MEETTTVEVKEAPRARSSFTMDVTLFNKLKATAKDSKKSVSVLLEEAVTALLSK